MEPIAAKPRCSSSEGWSSSSGCRATCRYTRSHSPLRGWPGASRANRKRCASNLHLRDRKSTRLNSSHLGISYAVFCLKKKKKNKERHNIIKNNDHRDYYDV